MNTPNTFNCYHHWARGANATLTLAFNHLPQWWTDTIDLHGEVYYQHSPTPEDSLVVKSSPLFLPYPQRIDNNFLKHLCLLFSDDVHALLAFQLQYFVAVGGDRDDWLRHTKDIIVDFLENSEQLSSHPLNFWGSRKIARTYRQNTYAALDLIGAKHTLL